MIYNMTYMLYSIIYNIYEKIKIIFYLLKGYSL